MSRYISPVITTTDLNGAPMVGAKLVFYESGTSTLKTIYSDEALTVPLTNPVTSVSSSAGAIYPRIFIDGVYKVVQQDDTGTPGIPDGAVLWTRDPVNSAFSAKDITVTPSGNITSTTQQDVNNELDSEKLQRTASIATLRDITPAADESIYVRYHTTKEDGGHGVFEALTGAGPGTYVDDNGVTILPTGGDGSSAWVRVYDGPTNVLWWGADRTGVSFSTDAFYAWAAHIGNDMEAVIPHGAYKLNTDAGGPIGFYGINIVIAAYGARLTEHGVSTITFDLNKNALPDESVKTNMVFWYGGKFKSNTAADTNADGVVDGNTNTAIRCRGITRAGIHDVFGEDFGRAFIEAIPVDALHLEGIHGYQNGRHIYTPDWTDATGNPQVWQLSNFGLSIHYVAGIDVEGLSNGLSISDGYFIGDSSIRLISRSQLTGINSQEVSINEVSFEQGSSTIPYIEVRDGLLGALHSMNIRGCGFGVSSDGVSTAVKVLAAARVNGLNFEGNHIVVAASGWMDLDANCSNIDIGVNDIITTEAISFSCSRREIRMHPYHLPVPDNEGRIDNLATFTTAGAVQESAIDVSALGFVSSTDALIATLPPIGYCIDVQASDDNSTTIVNPCYYQIVPDSSVPHLSGGYLHAMARPEFLPDNARSIVHGAYVQADANGDVWKQVRSTNGGTLTGYGRIATIYW